MIVSTSPLLLLVPTDVKNWTWKRSFWMIKWASVNTNVNSFVNIYIHSISKSKLCKNVISLISRKHCLYFIIFTAMNVLHFYLFYLFKRLAWPAGYWGSLGLDLRVKPSGNRQSYLRRDCLVVRELFILAKN